MDADEQARQLRAALKAAREGRGLSQTALGRQLGRSTYQTVYQWESGANQVTLSNFLAWAAALGFAVTLVPVPDEGTEAREW
jgi:transcriptional regulator with XRE-family HTH domain